MGALEGKVAIVTGGGQGIGRAACVEFAREGARVVIANRTVLKGKETARLCREAGGEALFVPTDVRVAADIRGLMDATVAAFGGLDILFNNAGCDAPAPVEELDESDWDRVVDTNLKGHFLCSKYAIPHLRARGGGVIINMSSVMGYSAMPGIAAYCATKAGIIGFTRALALELAPHNIRVNCLAPGSVDTDMLWAGVAREGMTAARRMAEEAQPVGYVAGPEQIARAAVWLAGRQVDFMTGSTLLIDGGVLARWPAPL